MATTDTLKTESLLEQFLIGFQELAKEITEKSIKQANDEDEKTVIQAFSPSVINQVSELNNYIREAANRSSKQQISEIEQVLKVTSGVSLTKNAKGILPSIGSIIGKLGLSRIIKEIKKIIRAIFEALGIKIPKWLDALFNIIDELFDSIFSAGSSKLATILSIQEQNYLAELTQLAKLQQANQYRNQEDEDDEK